MTPGDRRGPAPSLVLAEALADDPARVQEAPAGQRPGLELRLLLLLRRLVADQAPRLQTGERDVEVGDDETRGGIHRLRVAGVGVLVDGVVHELLAVCGGVRGVRPDLLEQLVVIEAPRGPGGQVDIVVRLGDRGVRDVLRPRAEREGVVAREPPRVTTRVRDLDAGVWATANGVVQPV